MTVIVGGEEEIAFLLYLTIWRKKSICRINLLFLVRVVNRVFYFRVLTTVYVQLAFGQQVKIRFFLEFNLKRNPVFAKKCWSFMVPFRKQF